MTPAERVAETRAMYVARGLCPYCYGARRAEPGKEGCRPCRDERNRRYNERRRQRIAQGLCGRCGRPSDRGITCGACQARVAMNFARYYRRDVARGICTGCGKAPARPGRILCEACAGYYRERGARQTRELQKLRPTCAHTDIRSTWILVADGVREGRAFVKVVWCRVCHQCRKYRQETVYADPVRLAEVLGWIGGPGLPCLPGVGGLTPRPPSLPARPTPASGKGELDTRR